MYPTHLMGTVQSGKREVKVKMKRAMSLVIKQLWGDAQKQSGKNKKKTLGRCEGRLDICRDKFNTEML